MRIEPATAKQIRQAEDGRMVEIGADISDIAGQLKRIDPGLKVRFGETTDPPFWAVYYESADGRDTYLITSATAYQTKTGVWTGLDQRLVDRIREIDSEDYSYPDALERHNRKVAREKQAALDEKTGEMAELAAHALRKDHGLGSYKGRVFLPRSITGK